MKTILAGAILCGLFVIVIISVRGWSSEVIDENLGGNDSDAKTIDPGLPTFPDLGQSAQANVPLEISDVAALEQSPGDQVFGQEISFDKLRPGLMDGDRDESQAAFRELLHYLDQNPEDFDEISAAFQSDPVLARNIAAFADTPADGSVWQARLLGEVARHLVRESGDMEIRYLALSVIGVFPDDRLSTVELMGRFARNGTRDEAQSAVVALASWIAQDSPLRERAAEELAQAISGLDDPELWSHAVSGLVSAYGGVPDSLGAEVLDFLESNPHGRTYSLVAHSLLGAGELAKPLTLELFGTAFLKESDSNVQRMILADLLQVGGTDSVTWADSLFLEEETLTQDTRDYLEILQSGIIEMSVIRELKAQRDAERGFFNDGE